MSHAKGASYERELVSRLREAGMGALRLGASGSGSDADLPDVLCARAHPGIERPTVADAYAVELKSGKATTLYVEADEVAALERFAARWGAEPLLGARSTQRGTPTTTYLLRPADARETDAGSFGLPIDGIAERASYAVSSDRGFEHL